MGERARSLPQESGAAKGPGKAAVPYNADTGFQTSVGFLESLRMINDKG